MCAHSCAGSLRPNTAQAFVEGAFMDLKKASQRLLQRQQEKQAQDVEAQKLAKKHTPGQARRALGRGGRGGRG